MSAAHATNYEALEAPFVDRYGQYAHEDWPGKVHDDADIADAKTAEDAWLAANGGGPVAGIDRFGVWASGPQLEVSGHFRTEKIDGRWWLVDPDGHLFFSYGVNVVRLTCGTGVEFRERFFEWLPEKDDPVFGGFHWRAESRPPRGFYADPGRVPYGTYDFGYANARRKYGPDWQAVTIERIVVRMRAWGLNTIGNWSDPEICVLRKLPYTASFATRGPKIEGSDGWLGKMVDPFAPEFAESARLGAENLAKRSGEDPWCLGWFVDNELNWGEDARELGRAILCSPASQPAKAEFRRLMEEKYGDIGSLDAAWGTNYGTWDAFLAADKVPDESRCGADLELMHRAVARKYYATVRDAVKAIAPHILYLGSRIAGRAADSIYEECARFCDVVSVNIYKREPMQELPPAAEDRPILIGEFHFCARDRGLRGGGLVTVRDQDERAGCYRDYVNACIDSPNIVGAHWFQWMDEPLTGRGDGEDFQCGLVDVADAPYPETIEAIRSVAARMYSPFCAPVSNASIKNPSNVSILTPKTKE
ncbi:MAG: beta-galactosidase [Kiritimatiellae bacterium]|nr:beta-galactosidase [Kiritimatiellia bacterium]